MAKIPMEQEEHKIIISEIQTYDSLTISSIEDGIRYLSITASDKPTGYTVIGYILRGWSHASGIFNIFPSLLGANLIAPKGSAATTITQLKIQWVFGKQ